MTSPSIVLLDQVMGIITILTNLLVTGIFLARAHNRRKLEKGFGLVMIALAAPVGAILLVNLSNGRPWWLIVLPAVFVIFNLVELALDYLLKVKFRQTRWVAAYLVLFYAAVIGMLGYVFAVGRQIGAAWVIGALGTYLISLLATWTSYKKVGHGEQ